MLKLYAHPFSSYSMKALIPLYENETPFEYKVLESPESWAELAGLWPIKLMPLLIDGGNKIAESSIVIEHLDLHHPGKLRMVPADAKAALHVRFLDRVFDNYVMTPMNGIVRDFIRDPKNRDPLAVGKAKDDLERAYAYLDQALPKEAWAAGGEFSLADCSAAPSLFYADWVHEIPERCANLRAYRARLLKRPSFARCIEEARPYRSYFPPGAPDRD
jgi:glutathione S-transferase